MNHQNEDAITDEELDIALGNLVDDLTGENEAPQENNRFVFEEDESYDFYTMTLKRLQDRDPSLQSLEICNPMEWGGLDRWRDEGGFLDISAWFQSLCELLCCAKHSPHVTHLELTNVLLDYPVLAYAVTDLLNWKDDRSIRSWKRLSIDDCMGVEPQFFGALQNVELSSLHLANNHLSESSLIALGDLLMTNKSICRLRISEHFTSAAAEALSTGLIQNTTLVQLEFLGSTFDDFAIPELASGLEENEGTRTLSFSHCHLQDHQLARLVYAVRQHRSLSWLDLSNNYVGANACDALQVLLSSSERDSLNTMGQETLCARMPCSASGQIAYLTGLSLVHTGIDDQKAIQIVSALATNNRFKHLHLCENAITNDGIQSLVSILPNILGLETLWVSENDFGDRGSQALLALVKGLDKMKDMVLDRHLSHYDDIQFQVLLNRGGHKALKDSTISLALWPLVFERCHRIKHFCRKAGPADSIYHLLRGPAIFNNPVLQKK
jgi:hypothetical protein